MRRAVLVVLLIALFTGSALSSSLLQTTMHLQVGAAKELAAAHYTSSLNWESIIHTTMAYLQAGQTKVLQAEQAASNAALSATLALSKALEAVRQHSPKCFETTEQYNQFVTQLHQVIQAYKLPVVNSKLDKMADRVVEECDAGVVEFQKQLTAYREMKEKEQQAQSQPAQP